ncbi:hypothetical protein Kpho02_02470 [Kitasatospora phosalacinea]|uniref:Uncharacterized protein n=1 Tax=Kitasatospora phosalacinea TaxID=2065 RepID=A0A9W6Q3N9_9ACTN|nr:hypothetical protein [Kitasatospora phosalacinea]GLW67948.1 hypothetical protein Kpho02_02470 [Kitasatospora phosalacinea]
MTQEQSQDGPADWARELAAGRGSAAEHWRHLPGWDRGIEMHRLLPQLFRLLEEASQPGRTSLLEVLADRADDLRRTRSAHRERALQLYAAEWERIVGLLDDERAETRRLAARLLAAVRPGRPEATAALKDRAGVESSPETLARLLTAVGAQGPGDGAAAWLRCWLDHPAPPVRLSAALALLELPDGDGAGVDGLGERAARLLGEPGAWQARPYPLAGPFGRALRDRPREAARFVTALAGRPGGTEQRVAVGVAIEQLRRRRRPAEAHWRTVLGTGKGEGSHEARLLLARSGRALAPYADELLALVEAEPGDTWLREGALVALVALGDRRVLPYYRDEFGGQLLPVGAPPPDWAADLLPTVRRVLGRAKRLRRWEVRGLDEALRVARSWGPAAAPLAQKLTALLDAPSITARAAAEALGEIGSQAAPAAGELARLATGRPWHGAQTAAWAHWRITGDPGLALRTVGAAARAGLGHPVYRYLAALGPLALDFAEPVRELLDAPGEFSRVGAAVAWWRITGDPAPALPVLLRQLAGPADGTAGEPTLRAVRLLGEIGAPAGVAAPPLRALLAAERRHGATIALDEELCAAARTALERLG